MPTASFRESTMTRRRSTTPSRKSPIGRLQLLKAARRGKLLSKRTNRSVGSAAPEGSKGPKNRQTRIPDKMALDIGEHPSIIPRPGSPAAGGAMFSSFARSLRALPFVFMLALAVPAVAWADDEGGGEGGNDAPEFDMTTAAAAFSLLAGGALMLTARRKSRMAA